MSNVGLVILAAGASTRMGSPKQLLLYKGKTLLAGTIETCLESVCHPIVVVLGANYDEILAKAGISDFPINIVCSDDWASGMSSSIGAGITKLLTLDKSIGGVVLATCDQPFLSRQIIDELVNQNRTSRKPIIASAYCSTLGVPAFFQRSLFSELTGLNGSGGAKQIIDKHAEQVAFIPFPDGAIDIDTKDNYAKLV